MGRDPTVPRTASLKTWIGLGALVALGTALVQPLTSPSNTTSSIPFPAAASSSAVPSVAHPAEQKVSTEALSAAASLAAAAGSLAKLQAARGKSRAGASGTPLDTVRAQAQSEPDPFAIPAPEAPAASKFESPTACMASYLPEIQLKSGSLDFVCRKTEMWSVERKAYARIAARKGEGARVWRHLGKNGLG